MLVSAIESQYFGTNCYIVAPAAGEQCVIVDPGINVQAEVDAFLREHKLQPVAVLLTHGHLDHTFSVAPVCGARGISAYIHPLDRDQLDDPMKYLGSGDPFGGRLPYTAPDDVKLLDPAEPLELAGMHVDIDFAPGHTPGSVMFRTPGPGADGDVTVPYLFSGDVLFEGSIGRFDLPGGSWEQMQTSLRTVILPMSDDTIVLPGHGGVTTIDRERRSNPYLRQLAEPPQSPRGL